MNGGGLHGQSSSGSSSPGEGDSASPTTGWNQSTGSKGTDAQYQPSLPPVAGEVLRTAYERHRRGLMSPYMYQLLTQASLISFDFVLTSF